MRTGWTECVIKDSLGTDFLMQSWTGVLVTPTQQTTPTLNAIDSQPEV